MSARKLGEKQRELLHRPFGKVMRACDAAVKLKKAKKNVVSVGDICSFNLIEYGFIPHISIGDGKSLREKISTDITCAIKSNYQKEYHVKNHAGTLNDSAMLILEFALLDKQGCYIEVDGEEDLLALAAMMKCKTGEIVVYGQPGQGMVYVKIDSKVKARAKAVFDKMKVVKK